MSQVVKLYYVETKFTNSFFQAWSNYEIQHCTSVL